VIARPQKDSNVIATQIRNPNVQELKSENQALCIRSIQDGRYVMLSYYLNVYIQVDLN
jgi:hypothetical protein